MPPGAGQAGQQCNQSRRVAATVHTLHAVVQADGGRLRGAEVARQAAHFVGTDAADRGRALSRPFGDSRLQLVETIDVIADVVPVEPAVALQFVHHAQRQRAVGAGQQRDVLVALVGRLGAARVDRNQLGAMPLGLLRQRPEMQVAGDRIAAPDDDRLALGEEAHVHAALDAVGGGQRVAAGGRADRAFEQRRAEPVEEAQRHALALHQAHRAGVAVRQNRLRVTRRNRLEPGRDVAQGVFP